MGSRKKAVKKSSIYDDLREEQKRDIAAKKGPYKPFKAKPKSDFLEPVTSKNADFNPLVFDIESKAGTSSAPGLVRPFLVGLYDGQSFQAFRNDPEVQSISWRRRHIAPGGCIDKLMTVVMSKHQGRKIYAHNGGGFDMLFLFAWLRRHPEYKFQITPVQSSILKLDVWLRSSKSPKKDRVTFLDSMRLLPGGLDKNCKAFGVVGKVEEKDFLWTQEDDPRWEYYLRGDCVCLREVLLKFHELVTSLGGDVATTTPATAMKLFRMKYLPAAFVNRIERHLHFGQCRDTVKCPGCLHTWLRRGYKGGRVEIFTMKGLDLHYYDFNSSYPAVLQQPMPIGSKMEEFGKVTWSMMDKHVGFVECDVFIPPSCVVPPLPFERNGKLIFPVGRFSGVWDAHELELLGHPSVKGRILSVKRAVWYRAESIFAPMIQELFKLRSRVVDGKPCPCASANPKPDSCVKCGFQIGLSELAKLLMNAFYGKFGMDPDREKILILDDYEGGKRREAPRGSKPAWHAGKPEEALTSDVWYAPERADADYIVPQIAAHVTALARRNLWKEMVRVVETPVAHGSVRVVDELLSPEGLPKLRALKTMTMATNELADDNKLWKEGDRGALVTHHRITKKEKGWETEQVVLIARERGFGRCVSSSTKEVVVEIGVEVYVSQLHPSSQVRKLGDIGELWTWGQLWYSDTDAILTDAVIPSSNKLGEMKDEYPNDMIDFEALQPKGYKVRLSQSGKTVVKFKGLSERARTLKNFEKMQKGETVSYNRLGKVRTLAAQDFWTAPAMVKVEKSVRSRYDKRLLLPDGTTMPIVLDGTRTVTADRFVGVE
jgi:hypothetical protein